MDLFQNAVEYDGSKSWTIFIQQEEGPAKKI